ncbi:hypothetical protein IMZ48_18170 [Candidatus Bathyarchaeota archaeon]|nr:hypothetical protein [Candidatus Bathyarchaeota archaeon]
MAPATKRRRKIVDSDDDEEGDRPQGNLLTRFLNSSPNPKGGASATSSHGPTASPSPLKKGARALNVRTPCCHAPP